MGASEARIFFQICLPLSLPGIATITLLTALGFWNDWFNALLYIKSDNLYPLQYLLMQIQQKYGLHRQSSRPVWSTGSCSTERNRTYGHGCGGNPSNRDFVSILPTLLCKRFDYRWCERIVLVEKNHSHSKLPLREVKIITLFISLKIKKRSFLSWKTGKNMLFASC